MVDLCASATPASAGSRPRRMPCTRYFVTEELERSSPTCLTFYHHYTFAIPRASWICCRVHSVALWVSARSSRFCQDAALEASWPGHKPQTICVIGAGPAGLSALKIIRDSSQFREGLWNVTAFEARDNVGGVW